MLHVTEVRIHKVKEPKEDSPLKAFATVTYGSDAEAKDLAVSGYRILEGKNGMFVSPSQHADGKGNYYDDVITLTRELRDEVQTKVLESYNQA